MRNQSQNTSQNDTKLTVGTDAKLNKFIHPILNFHSACFFARRVPALTSGQTLACESGGRKLAPSRIQGHCRLTFIVCQMPSANSKKKTHTHTHTLKTYPIVVLWHGTSTSKLDIFIPLFIWIKDVVCVCLCVCVGWQFSQAIT